MVVEPSANAVTTPSLTTATLELLLSQFKLVCVVLEGVSDATLISKSFGNAYGQPGEWFVAIAMLLFAFTTVLGWSHYGTKAFEYLFGTKATIGYKIFFVCMVMSGALMTSSIAWDISDTFNGLMMFPNLIGVVTLSGLVVKITKNYIDRKIKGKDIEPMLSVYEDVTKEVINYEDI